MAELRGSATLTVSSEFNASFLKANAVDGNTSTDWASAAEGTASWIQFTWGASVTIREIRLLDRSTDAWGTPKFTFSAGSDIEGSPWLAGGSDITYVLLTPRATTSLRVGVVTAGAVVNTGSNTGFKECYINDAYTIAPTTDLTIPARMTASSYFSSSGTWSYRRIIDGNTGTEWACNGDGSAAWVQWNYDAAVYITSIQLRDRAGAERWGTPRFTFDDASTQDGSGAVSNTGYTTYMLGTPKTTTSLRVSVASGSSGSNIGLAEAVITGNVTAPSASRLAGTAIQIIG